MAKTRRVKFEFDERSLASLDRLKEQGAFVMSDSSDCSTADDDFEVSVEAAELRRLRNVFSASSDLVKAYSWEEFREASGGIEALKEAHSKAVCDLEQWYSDGDDRFCR